MLNNTNTATATAITNAVLKPKLHQLAEQPMPKVRTPARIIYFPINTSTKKKEVEILHSPVITVQLENNAVRANELLLALRLQLSGGIRNS